MTEKKKAKTLVQQILEIENRAIKTMERTRAVCETKTGRTLSKRAGTPDIPQVSKDHELKDILRQLGVHVARNYQFQTVCDFRKWARTFFIQGWKRGGGRV